MSTENAEKWRRGEEVPKMRGVWYCAKCRLHVRNPMGFFCPVCHEDKYLSPSRGSLFGEVMTL